MAGATNDDDKFYTTAEMAELFRVDAKSVTRWAREGRFGPNGVIRTPGGHRRFRRSAVDPMLRGGSR